MLKEAYLQVEEEGEKAEMWHSAHVRKKINLEAEVKGAVHHCRKVRLYESTPEAARGEKGRFRRGNESES